MRFNLQIEFTIRHCLIFRTAWYGPIEIDIIVNLFILNNIFMVSWFLYGYTLAARDFLCSN